MLQKRGSSQEIVHQKLPNTSLKGIKNLPQKPLEQTQTTFAGSVFKCF